MGQDALSGLCCDDEANNLNNCKTLMAKSDFCVKGSDAKAGGIFKYTRCPFDQVKCGHPQRKIVTDNWKRTVYTSLTFGKDDICPYYIANEITFQYEMKIELQVVGLSEAKAFLLSGTSLNDLTTSQELKEKEVYSPKPSEVHAIIVQPASSTATSPYVAFSIENKPIRDYQELGIRYGQIMVGISLILCVVGICLAQFVIKAEIPGKMESQFSSKLDKYPEKLQGYIRVGNVWDPEEEAQIEARARERAPNEVPPNASPFVAKDKLNALN